MATYVWTDEHGRGRNRFGLFRRKFTLTGQPFVGLIRLWADSRYRLIVNGVVICHGPARFFKSEPQYDEIDLTAFLRQGPNVIAVIVNSPGAVHYQGEEFDAAFIAWGDVRDDLGNIIDLSTPTDWKGINSPGHTSETHSLSFALSPAERLDLRDMPEGWDSPGFDDSRWPNVVARTNVSYGPLVPRSIPLLDEREVLPRQMAGIFTGSDEPGEDVYSLILAPADRTPGVPPAAAALTFVHSPREQTVTFSGWWGRYFLNGTELKSDKRDEPRRRQSFTATFRAGWNALLSSERFHWAAWELYLRFPRSAELQLSASREPGSAATFLIAGAFTDRSLGDQIVQLHPTLISAESLPAHLGPWRPWSRSQSAQSPHRERAARNWVRLDHPLRTLADVNAALHHAPRADSVAILFDLGAELLGRPIIDLTAPAGTTLDLTYTESLTADGRADVHRRYLIDMAERYTLGDGPQQVRTFHPRGCRYVELVLTPPPGQSFDTIQIHRVAFSRAMYPVQHTGSFECSDPTLNQIWKLGAATQHACMEDAYLDCPMRERGLYVGDTLVQFFTNLAAFGDTKLFRRSLDLFLQSADPSDNGLVAGGAHGLPPGRHPDYSALIPWMLMAYFDRTGDLDFLLAQKSRVQRLLHGLDDTTVEGCALVDGSDLGLYIDTAAHDHDGVNAPNNAFTFAAFNYGADYFRRLGDVAAADTWDTRASALARDFHTHFFDPTAGAYVDRLHADKPDTRPSVHGNSLALLFGICPPTAIASVEQYLLTTLADNRRAIPPRHSGDFHVSSYFSFYTLTALLQRGHGPFVLDFIRTNWSIFLSAGAVTTWEYFSDDASLCHAWSTCPTHLLSTHVLGVSFPFPGDLTRVRICPEPCGLAFAEGTYPHPSGPISVSWKVVGGKLNLSYTLPRGVTAVS